MSFHDILLGVTVCLLSSFSCCSVGSRRAGIGYILVITLSPPPCKKPFIKGSINYVALLGGCKYLQRSAHFFEYVGGPYTPNGPAVHSTAWPSRICVRSFKNCLLRTSLRSQVVKNLPFNAGDMGLIPGRGTKVPTCRGANKPECYNS